MKDASMVLECGAFYFLLAFDASFDTVVSGISAA
jgi:hypothetical protein